MDAVSEIFPAIAGVLTGVVCSSISRGRLRMAAWAALTIVFGALATYLSGEYRESWGFVVLDMFWVGAISIAIILGVRVYRGAAR